MKHPRLNHRPALDTAIAPGLRFEGQGRRASEAGCSAAKAMKSLALILLATLSFVALSSASEALPASKVTWNEHFGESRSDTNTLFCLMAHGYFRSESTNIQTVLEAWLKSHPKAVVVTVVSGGPVLTTLPHSKQAFVLLVQEAGHPNLEHVRQGRLAPQTHGSHPRGNP